MKIQRARQLLARLEPRRGHVLLDHTVARFLWGAISAADGVRIIAEERRHVGAEPLLRYVFESSLNLQYLLNLEDPDVAAVHTFIADIRNAHTERDLVGTLQPNGEDASEAQEFDLPPVEEALKILKLHLVEDLGEDPEELERVFEEAESSVSSHWHWSGRPPGALIRPLWEAKEPEEPFREMFASSHRGQWKAKSNRAHPSPRWEQPGLVTVDGSGKFTYPDPLEEDEQGAAVNLLICQLDLKEIIRTVADHYGLQLHGSSPEEIMTWVVGFDLDPVDPTAEDPREG